MHPVFQNRKQTLLITAGWLSVVSGLIFLQDVLLHYSWERLIVLFAPFWYGELFVFLSLYFLCKTIDFEKGHQWIDLAKHAVAMVIVLALILQTLMLYAEILVFLTKLDIWRTMFYDSIPLFLTVTALLYFLAILFHYLLLAQDKIQQTRQDILQNQYLAVQAQLRSLKNSIHPHFLFNSLNALNTLIEIDPGKAQKICLRLADFLRYNLQYAEQDLVSVREEIDQVQNYLDIERLRLGYRLRIKWEIDPQAREGKVPPFILQPLLGNAIKHGLSEELHGGEIQVRIQVIFNQLTIRVGNTYDPNRDTRGTGLGLSNLRSRLDLTFKGAALLNVHKNGTYFEVEISLPYEKQ